LITIGWLQEISSPKTMAKLFRKIRQKLLAENSLKKYFIYAIGEIILVVIGILIALQINTINQNQKREKLESVLLKQVKFELQEIYEDVWRDIARLQLGAQSHHLLYQCILQDKAYTDSLCFDFYWIQVDEYIYPTNTAYSKLKQTGLDIIKNNQIRIALRELYEGYFPRLSTKNAFIPDISNVFNTYYLDHFRPNSDTSLLFNFQLAHDTVGSRFYKDVDFIFPKIKDKYGQQQTIGYVPLSFEALKKDTKFQMLLEQTNRHRNNKLIHYLAAQSTIKEVVSLIENNK